MSVGFRPSAVHLADDGSRAFVVTEDGVSILDFAEIEAEGSTTALPVPVSGSLDKKALDVSITPDGRHALAREQEGGVLRLVNLETGAAEELDLAPLVASSMAAGAGGSGGADGGSGNVGGGGTTSSSGGSGGSASVLALPLEVGDVDLSPSGEFALAVVRSHSLVLTIPVPEGFSDSSQVEAVPVAAGVIGSVTLSADGRYALLYTTVRETDEWLTILDLQTGELKTVDLRKSVQGVAMAPDGSTALVVHQELPGDPALAGDEELELDRSHASSVVELQSGFAKLQVTESEVMAFTLVVDAAAWFLLLQQPWEAPRVQLDSFVVDRVTLASKPVAIGVVPESEKVFVGQEHPDGRITFVNWNNLETTSVTGFELDRIWRRRASPGSS
jgi:hypothetical protein